MEDWRRGKGRRQRLETRDPNLPVVDVSFFAALEQLAHAVSNLVGREGQRRFPGSTITADIAVTLRHLIYTFNLLRYINADDKRDYDPDYRQAYSFVVLPVMRTMIDGFYNVTTFLDNPVTGNTFRLSGYFRMKEALAEEELRYGPNPKWTDWLKAKHKELSEGLRADGFTMADLTTKPKWPLLGSYLGTEPKDTPHKNLLRTFTLGNWGMQDRRK